MQLSVIVTVLNEEKTIHQLLVALANQTKKAQEIIIVDAQSRDNTLQLIKQFAELNPQLNIKCFVKAGNRSVGRNFAIKKTKFDWIAITDAGCVPHDDWLAELVDASADANTIVAGYYDAQSKTAFEEAVVPYVLVMPDRVDEHNFLPATRSMLLHRSVWEKLHGFNENLTVSEDYHFAKKLVHDPELKIVFTSKAKVTWLPRQNLREFYRMAVGMAEGDARGKIMRVKAWLVLIRLLAFLLFSLAVFLFDYNRNSQQILLINLWLLIIGLYLMWAISKNQKYVPKGWYWLPVLQLTSDLAVVFGSIRGMIKRYEQDR